MSKGKKQESSAEDDGGMHHEESAPNDEGGGLWGAFRSLFGVEEKREDGSDEEEEGKEGGVEGLDELMDEKDRKKKEEEKKKKEKEKKKKEKELGRRKSVWDSMREMVTGPEQQQDSMDDESVEKDMLDSGYAGRVLVTGAEGYIAGHLIKLLIQKGFKVLGTVRSLRNELKHAHLMKLVPEIQESNPTVLELGEADLTRTGTFDEHIARCEYIIHLASPFKLGVRDAKVGLINPAVQGTLNILNGALRVGHIKRVVLVSCHTALCEKPSGREYSESDWNESSNVESYPYHASKTEAERQAFEFVKKLPADKRFELVSVLPSVVIGPVLAAENTTLNTSLRIMADIMKGILPWIPKMGLPLVDVRDVANSLLQALINPNANGRYICHCDTMMFSQVVKIMKTVYKRGRFPEKERGKFFTRRNEVFMRNMPFQYIRPILGKNPVFSNRKIRRELGVEFIPIEKSVIDMCEAFNRFNM